MGRNGSHSTDRNRAFRRFTDRGSSRGVQRVDCGSNVPINAAAPIARYTAPPMHAAGLASLCCQSSFSCSLAVAGLQKGLRISLPLIYWLHSQAVLRRRTPAVFLSDKLDICPYKLEQSLTTSPIPPGCSRTAIAVSRCFSDRCRRLRKSSTGRQPRRWRKRWNRPCATSVSLRRNTIEQHSHDRQNHPTRIMQTVIEALSTHPHETEIALC